MIRKPVVSGRFYPAGKNELQADLDTRWNHSLAVGKQMLPRHGRLRAVIVPHAGYMFSGPIATWGFQRIAQENPVPKRFLVLGPKHTPYGEPAAIARTSAWQTPLGVVPVDDELRSALVQQQVFTLDDQAHAYEHSIEVQLPFLQRIVADRSLEMVPLALTYADFNTCQKWADGLRQVLAQPQHRSVTMVISSDFSHETPRQEAYRLDEEAMNLLIQGDVYGFYRLVIEENRSICGFVPITVALLALADRRLQISKLAYATSMDVHSSPTGVGYAALAIEEIEEPA